MNEIVKRQHARRPTAPLSARSALALKDARRNVGPNLEDAVRVNVAQQQKDKHILFSFFLLFPLTLRNICLLVCNACLVVLAGDCASKQFYGFLR